MNPISEYAASISIDWADRKHNLCLKTICFDVLEHTILEHKPEAIKDLANDLRVGFRGKPVAVCIESRKVPLIHALLKYDFLVLFPVNPQTLCRCRRTLVADRVRTTNRRIAALKLHLPQFLDLF